MKRIKSDELQSTVKQYLKRRQYLDAGELSKQEASNVQSLPQMAVSMFVSTQDCVANKIRFSSISGDATACDQQYNRIKCFIHEAIEPHRTELRPLLYALFVHVYLELVQNGQKVAAHKFYSRHQGAFRSDPEQQDLLGELQRIVTRDSVRTSPLVKEFREHRYHVTLSNDTIGFLFRYLKSGDNVLMLQIFNQHIVMQVRGCQPAEELVARDDRLSSSLALASPPCAPENRVMRDEAALGTLQRCLRRVRGGPAPAPSVCLYTVRNADQGLCCAALDAGRTTLCAGFEDSSLRLWSLLPDDVAASTATTTGAGVSRVDVTDTGDEATTRSSRSECVTLRGHSGAVYGVSVDTAGQVALSVSQDCTIRLWDLKTHQNRVSYRGHSYPVWGIDRSETTDLFASCSQDRTAKLWTADRTYPLRTFVGHLLDVDCVQFHPNGSLLLTGSRDRTLRLWSTSDAASVRLLAGHRSPVVAAAVAPNGRQVASAGADGRVRLWDVGSGRTLAEMSGGGGGVVSLAFSADSSLLAAGGADCSLWLWDVQCATSNANATERPPAAAMTTTPSTAPSPRVVAVWPTPDVALHLVRFTSRNLLLAVGATTSQ